MVSPQQLEMQQGSQGLHGITFPALVAADISISAKQHQLGTSPFMLEMMLLMNRPATSSTWAAASDEKS